jgi:hypothetical protein
VGSLSEVTQHSQTWCWSGIKRQVAIRRVILNKLWWFILIVNLIGLRIVKEISKAGGSQVQGQPGLHGDSLDYLELQRGLSDHEGSAHWWIQNLDRLLGGGGTAGDGAWLKEAGPDVCLWRGYFPVFSVLPISHEVSERLPLPHTSATICCAQVHRAQQPRTELSETMSQILPSSWSCTIRYCNTKMSVEAQQLWASNGGFHSAKYC